MVECAILEIKKTSVKTLKIGLYSVFLNAPIKHVQDRKRQRNFIAKEKDHSFISTSLQLQH